MLTSKVFTTLGEISKMTEKYYVYSGSRALSGFYPNDIPGVFAFRRNDRLVFDNKKKADMFIKNAQKEVNSKENQERYGPYAKNLRHVLNAIEGHLISGYADGGDKPDKPIELVPGAYEDSKKFLEIRKDTLKRFQKVSQLVNGFESQFGLELLSTVHWVINKEGANSLEDVIKMIHIWSARKKQFSNRQIAIAVNTLLKNEWINSASFAM